MAPLSQTEAPADRRPASPGDGGYGALRQALDRALKGRQGHDYLTTLSATLRRELGAKLVTIGYLDPDLDGKVRIQYGDDGTGHHPAPVVDFKNSPGARVLGKSVYVVSRDCARRFAKDPRLRANGIEGYVGCPLFRRHDGSALGLIATMFDRPLDDAPLISEILESVADRAGLELEHVELRRELTDREQLYRTVLDNAPVAVAVKDPTGRYLMANRTLADWNALPAERMIGATPADIYTPHRAAFIRAQDSACLATGQPRQFASRWSSPGGRVQMLESLSFPIHDETGGIAGVGTIDIDATERHGALDALHAKERRISTIGAMLVDMLVDRGRESIDLTDFATLLAGRICGVLQVERASVWLIDPAGDRADLVALCDAENAGAEMEDAFTLLKDADAYFRTLMETGFVRTTNVERDPEALCLRDYLEPQGIKAFYDFLVRVRGEPRAILSIESRSAERVWSDEDTIFITAAGGVLAQQLATMELQTASDTLRRLNEDLEFTVARRTADLERSQERLADIVDATADCIFEMDAAGRVLFLSERGAHLFGRGVDQVIGRTVRDLVAGADGEVAAAASESLRELESAIGETRAFSQLEMPIGHDEDDRRVLRWNGRPCVLDDGVPGFRGGVSDVTVEVTAREDLIENDHFTSLGRLVAGVAHEVNTPLGVAVTVATTMSERLADLREDIANGRLTREGLAGFLGKLGDGLDLLRSNLDRAATLIQSFKRVSVDQSHDAVRQIDLTDYVHSIVNSLSPVLRSENIELALDLPETFPMITQPGALSQVLSNLILNAGIHAYGGAGGRVTVEATPDGTGRVKLDVRDFGKGMPPEVKEHIFQPFFTTNRANGGSGLGLSVVHGLVTRNLGGSIRVASRPDEGSCFHIKLPVRLDGEDQAP